MYVNNNNNNASDVMSYIDGNDIYNSKLIKRMKDIEFTNKYYILNNQDKRMDIIAKSVYNDSKKESFIELLNKEVDVNNEKYVKVVEDINTFISVLNI